MRILMICDFFNENLEYQENLLVKYYRKHGHEVTVITSVFESIFDLYTDRYDKSAKPRTYFYDGAKIIKLQYQYNFLNKIRKYTSIKRILEEESPDLIYVHDIMPNILDCRDYMNKNPYCKMIMDYHADYSNSAKNWISLKILHGILRRYIYLHRSKKYISRYFPVVPGGIDFLNEVYGVPVEEMEVLPLGADTDYAQEVKQKQEGKLIRRSLKIPEDAFVIFSGGKLHPNKKTEILIDAINQLNDKNLHLIIVGESDKNDLSYKEMLLSKAKNNNNIHFLGWQSSKNIYRYMNASDIAVFPASQSILWQQAICMGLPLVTGDSGGQSMEFLNDHDNIIIHAKDQINTDAFIKTILNLRNNPEKIRRMQEGAAKVADERLNWNKLIYKTLQFNKSNN